MGQFDGDVPEVYAETAQTLTTNLSSDVLAASGAFTYSDIIDVRAFRRITLFLDYDPHASSTTGAYPQVVPFVSSEADVPAAGADSWFGVGDDDGTVTATVLTGTLPSGADWSLAPEWASRTFRGLVIRLEGSDAAANEYRVAVTLDVTPYRWLQLAAAEEGDTTNPGSLKVQYVRSV